MKRLAGLIVAGALIAAPAMSVAEETEPKADPSPPLMDPFENFQVPDETRESIEQFVDMLMPMFDRLQLMFQDLPSYEAPEVLPNGDIIIRRRRPDVLPPEFEEDEDGQIKT